MCTAHLPAPHRIDPALAFVPIHGCVVSLSLQSFRYEREKVRRKKTVFFPYFIISKNLQKIFFVLFHFKNPPEFVAPFFWYFLVLLKSFLKTILVAFPVEFLFLKVATGNLLIFRISILDTAFRSFLFSVLFGEL